MGNASGIIDVWLSDNELDILIGALESSLICMYDSDVACLLERLKDKRDV